MDEEFDRLTAGITEEMLRDAFRQVEQAWSAHVEAPNLIPDRRSSWNVRLYGLEAQVIVEMAVRGDDDGRPPPTVELAELPHLDPAKVDEDTVLVNRIVYELRGITPDGWLAYVRATPLWR